MKNILMLFLLAASLLSACNGVRLVSADKLNSGSQANYDTFGFAELSKRVKVNRADTEKTRAVLEEAVIKQMEASGYVYSDENPDLLVDMQLNYIKSNRSSSPYNNRYNPYGGFSRYYYGRYSYNDLQNEPFAQENNIIASIEILFADRSQIKKLWEGTGEAKLAGRLDKRIERLELVVEKLIVGFEEGTER